MPDELFFVFIALELALGAGNLLMGIPWGALCMVVWTLCFLVSNTGTEAFKSYATAGPATLAGPAQPWQEA
jgi:hypothetical protein